MKWRMKCPKCKNDFQRGGRYCANCGLELGQPRWLGIILLVVFPFWIAFIAWRVIRVADNAPWFFVVIGLLSFGFWVFLLVLTYRWFTWTRPGDSKDMDSQKAS